jgi:hypothetical protein
MILGLDVSTSIVGVCILENDKIVHTAYIDLRKIKNFFEKGQEVENVLKDIKKNFKIEHIYIEQALMFFRRGGSTAKTMSILQRFNGIVSWICYNVYDMEPNYITPIGARSKCGIKVKRGQKAKEIVMKHFLDNEDFGIVYTKKGNIQKYCYDMADAIVVARAGYYLLQESL